MVCFADASSHSNYSLDAAYRALGGPAGAVSVWKVTSSLQRLVVLLIALVATVVCSAPSTSAAGARPVRPTADELAVRSVATPARAASCSPYCDATTVRVANRLGGRGHGGWLATTLDDGGYHGRRWAEIDQVSAGHGKRFVGVIHVPPGKAAKVRAALSDVWIAQRGTVFVLPLVTRDDTRGGAGSNYRKTARWAAARLGQGWVVR